MGNSKFKRYFFVDMENVHRDGLKGIEELTSKDCVMIYYSDPNDNIPLGVHMHILTSPAHFEYIRIDMPIKNAADCKILFDITDLSKEHKKAEFVIISKDSDFDKPIMGFLSRDVKVKKLTEINGKDAIERERFVRGFIMEHFEHIDISEDREANIERTIRAVLNGRTKNEVNANLMKIFDSRSVKIIYEEIKPLVKDLPGQ